MAEKSFPFIVLNGPRLEDPGARRIIRKQAMKDVGNARKQRGNLGRANKKPLPVLEDTAVQIRPAASSDSSRESSTSFDLTSPEISDSSNSTDATDYDEIVPREDVPTKRPFPVTDMHAASPLSFMAINLFSNYETARAKFMVDVTDLSVLTNFNIGKGTISQLAKDPMRLASLLGHQQWYEPLWEPLLRQALITSRRRSYLQFVPSLYGASRCLTAATNCVLAKVKGVLSPHDQCKDVTLRLYTKALRTLQDAISHETDCLEADVLCATGEFSSFVYPRFC